MSAAAVKRLWHTFTDDDAGIVRGALAVLEGTDVMVALVEELKFEHAEVYGGVRVAFVVNLDAYRRTVALAAGDGEKARGWFSTSVRDYLTERAGLVRAGAVLVRPANPGSQTT